MRTIYEANDGSHFNSSEECQQHDSQTKFSKYKNYTELHENVYDLCCVHIKNNTELFTTAAFIIDNIELLSLMITTDLKQVVKSGEFMAGQTILVRDSEFDDWKMAVFVQYGLNDMIYPYVCEGGEGPYVCEAGEGWGCIGWKYAKSI
jgi:hypothetical protein